MSADPFRPPSGLPPLVLLVDDEPDILVALQDLIEDEFRVLSSISPHEALAILAREPDITVIVSDQRMPGMTGDAFLAHARRISAAEALMLTGYADLSAVVSALNEGRISGYLHKPWEPAALLATIRQAAARAELGAALRAERMLLNGLMDSAGDALSFKDTAGRYIRLNAIAAGRLGHAVAACIGETERMLAADVADTAELARIEAEDRLALAGNVEADRTLHPIERGGRQLWMERLRAPLRDETGTIRALATFERDVTEHRALEDRLRQADRMQALGTMAGGVAHDFNNLLTAILGSLELAARAAGPNERLQRLLETASAAADRGAALTQRLLSFSRQRETALLAVDVNGLVRAMDDLLARSIDRPGIRIVQALAPMLPSVLVDPAQLELALLNLCINARDAMGDAGIITLGTRSLQTAVPEPDELLVAGSLPDGPCVAVSVADTGCGMSQAVAARIFEPFFTTKEIGHGTGLGLSMVYGFMQQSGGTVRLRTAPGRGACFELCLPVVA